MRVHRLIHLYRVRPGPLIDILLAHLRLNNPRGLEPGDHNIRRNANRFVRGLQVRVNVGRHSRPRRIDHLTEVGANMYTFDKQGKTVSVRVRLILLPLVLLAI